VTQLKRQSETLQEKIAKLEGIIKDKEEEVARAEEAYEALEKEYKKKDNEVTDRQQ
jgi:chromosome segregation ATPase